MSSLLAISAKIFRLTEELGNLEGKAQERGYPGVSSAHSKPCTELVASKFHGHLELVRGMRADLETIYTKIGKVSKECEDVTTPEVKVIFEKQIEALHERRGVLENAMRSFSTLLTSHRLIEEVQDELKSLQECIQADTANMDWEALTDSVDELLVKLDIVFPENRRGSKDFCQFHYDLKLELLTKLRGCTLDLNFKHQELQKKANAAAKPVLEQLILGLSWAVDHPEAASLDEVRKNAQAAFASLPLELRLSFYLSKDLLPEKLHKKCETLVQYSNEPKLRKKMAEMQGVDLFNRERDLYSYHADLGGFSFSRLRVRERARETLNAFAAELPSDVLEEPKALLDALVLFLKKDSYIPESRAVAALLYAIQEVVEVVDKGALFEGALGNVPSLNSLEELKAHIQAYSKGDFYTAAQKEELIRVLLQRAEDQGVRLDADQGVYYWIWFLAHEADPKAGGANFGKENAPKDLERLLRAFEKVVPGKEREKVEVSVPVVPAPSAQVLSPKVHERRGSSPSPVLQRVMQTPAYVGSPRPSEIKAQRRNSSAPAVETPTITIEPPKPAPVITEIKIKCKVPSGHTLTIRGEGGGLEWGRGQPLVKIDDETYAYRVENAKEQIKYKLVLDDVLYENGQDHVIEMGMAQEIVPALAMPKVFAEINYPDTSKKLFVRGTGRGMSWDKSMPLKMVDGKFVLESSVDMGSFEFKVLVEDKQWSTGENFKVEKGKTLVITPKF